MRFIVIRARFGSLDLPALGQDERSINMGGKDGGMDIGNWDPYPKKDHGQREWDRSYYPPIELPPQIYQPPIPPPEWQTPCPSARSLYGLNPIWKFLRTTFRLIMIILVTALGNGLLWVLMRSASISLFPNEGMIVAFFPMFACTGFNALLLAYLLPTGEIEVVDIESFFLLLSVGICCLLLALLSTADLLVIQGR